MANKRAVGRPPGTPKTGGRQKGTQNRVTTQARDALMEAADRLGGVDRLVAWAKEDEANEKIFWSSMWVRTMPKEIKADVAAEVQQTFDAETIKKMASEFIKRES